MYAPQKLKEYHLDNKDLPGPLVHLIDWLKAYNDGADEYDDLAGDKEMDGRSRTSCHRTREQCENQHHCRGSYYVQWLFQHLSCVYSRELSLSLQSSVVDSLVILSN